MYAKVGDKIVVRGNRVAEPERDAVVVEVRGSDGAPPYVVRWSDGHEGLYFPGPDAVVEGRSPGSGTTSS